MLIRKWQDANLYEADATQGSQQTATPPPATSQDKKTEDKGEDVKLSLTQRELNRITAKEVKSAKEAANKAILSELGIESLDSLKNLISAAKEAEEGKKTEAQKLADELAKLKSDLENERKAKEELSKLRRIESRDNKLLSLLSKAHEPQDVLATLKATQSAKLDEFLSDDGDFDSEAASTFIADYQKQKPYLFKDERRGSQSNNDGRIPNPDKDRRKAVEKKLSNTIKGF